MGRRIRITVKPRAKKPEITKVTDGQYRVTVRAPAQDGEANLALIDLLADYFKVPKSTIKILRRQSSRRKLIEIGD